MSVKCKNCKNFKDDWCEKVVDSPCPDLERDCNHFVQATNADRIRAMSDEELGDFICNNTKCESCRFADVTGCTVREYLQQPAEEE